MDESSPIPSTSTANINPPRNANRSPTFQDNEQSKRKSDDDLESDTIRSKVIKPNIPELNEKFNSLLSEFNKDARNLSVREVNLKRMQKECFVLYKPVRDYLLKNYFTRMTIESDDNIEIYNVCDKCGKKYKVAKRNSMFCVKHILIDHKTAWPTDVKIDNNVDDKKQISKLVNEVQPNDNVQNRDEIRMSSRIEALPSLEVLFIDELNKCYNILKRGNSITKEIYDSLKDKICNLKCDAGFMDNLIFDARKSYSLILTKHLLHKDVFLSLILMYISSDKICSQFYRLIKATSDNIDVLNQLEKDGLKINQFVGFGFDVTEDKDIIELTVSNLNEKIKDRSNIIINKHMSEPMKIIVKDAHVHISSDVEFLIKETYNWFKLYNGQEFVSLKKKILDSTVFIESIDDVWFLKLDLVSTIVDNWKELEEHFEKTKYSYDHWRIYRLYKNKNNKLYLRLIRNSLIPINNFFEFFHSSSITKDRWDKKLQNITDSLNALANIIEGPEEEISQYEDNKKKFLKSLSFGIDKFLKSNKNCTPIAIPIFNEKIKEIDSCVDQSIDNFKDNVSAEMLGILEACLQIKFMREDT